ncbi:MAG: MFS transporter [Spirochaetota bacterium]
MKRGIRSKAIPLTVIMLGLVSLFTDAATEMIYPLIPIFVATLGSGALILGIIEGVAETTASLLKLASGVISDAIGKRKLLVLIGYGISSIVRPLTAIVTGAWQIVFVRMADRVGKGIRTAPRDALIASSVDASIRGKSYGFHRAMDHTGAVIGPFLAILTLFIVFVIIGVNDVVTGLRITFAAAIIPGALAVGVIIFFVKEAKPAQGTGKIDLSPKGLSPNFFRYLAVALLFTLGNSSDAFLLFRVEEAMRESGALISIVQTIPPLAAIVNKFGDAATQAKVVTILFLPIIWAFFHIIKVIFATPLGALSDRIGRRTVIVAGWAIYAAVYIAFGLLDSFSPTMQLIMTFVLFAVYALFYSFTEGTEKAFVADLVPEKRRASAFGLYHFAVGIGALPASIIFGALYASLGARFAFSFGALLALAAMALMLGIVREGKKR